MFSVVVTSAHALVVVVVVVVVVPIHSLAEPKRREKLEHQKDKES
jgi:hypothetical protein